MKYKIIDACRSCNGKELESVYDLGELCFTGIFEPPGSSIASAPLEVLACQNPECTLVQLSASCDPHSMYGEGYGYRSSLNKSMVEHLKQRVATIEGLTEFKDNDVVVDIGSNDGTTLGFYSPSLYRVGVDPTAKQFKQYYKEGIHIVEDFFDDSILNKLPKPANVITSFSMFYDLENPTGFAINIEKCLAEDGYWVCEQSYLPRMLETISFDTICHEHLEYYSIKSVDFILKRAGLKMIDVEFNEINGGSFCFTAVKKANHLKPSSALLEARNNETEFFKNDVWDTFKNTIQQEMKNLLEFLEESKADNKSILGLGASTKGCILLQHYEINSSLLPSIGEVNASKFGMVTSGSKIPITSEQDVLDNKPDYLLVLPWHFRDFFLKNEKFAGHNLVFPLPKFEIVKV